MAVSIDKRIEALRLYDFEDFGREVNAMGLNFALTDNKGGLVYLAQGEAFRSNQQQLKEASQSFLQSAAPDAVDMEDGILGVLLRTAPEDNDCVGVAMLDLGRTRFNENDSEQLTVAALGQLLRQLAVAFARQAGARGQIEMVSTELSQVYEELVLLHKLSANMKVTESDCNYLQMACDNLTDIVSVEGIAILLEKVVEGQKQLILAAGSGLIDIDGHLAGVLHDRLEQEVIKGKEALLDSDIDSPFKYHWPENVRNIIAVPLFAKDKGGTSTSGPVGNGHNIIGIMVAVNRVGRPDFDSIDAKLFNSVANGCAVFIENGRLFNDLKELFIGSLKALTSSIDAKDPYTRGHSERVAFISKWIAEQLAAVEALDREQIHRVYLAGLLHDIGKMGVDEAVLRKKGKLSDAEFAAIREHPSIGAGILGGIKQMQDIVPGVLTHHERCDGKGYPNGLVGEQIPLIGRIISLADSFDAMTSKRTYRDAMTVDVAMEEIRKGLGTQFDKKLGELFLNSDVYHLWDMIQDGLKDIYSTEDESKYELAAVGALIS